MVDDVTEKGLKLVKMGWYVARKVLGAVNRVVSRVRRNAEDINGSVVERETEGIEVYVR